MIAAHGVSKRFGRRQVIDGLEAEVATGRITALVGPNGAGKTTFLKVLLGLVRPDAGCVAVDGHALDGSAAYRAAIGYMPQIARFPAYASGRDLLDLLRALRGGTEEPDLSLAEAFGLGDGLDRPVGVLSGGMRQKVNAVLAFAFQPRLLILDEPTAGLDPLGCRILKDRVLAERAIGTTVLITSHVLPELEELADDVLLLGDGRTTWSGSVHDLKVITGAVTLERAVAGLLADRPMTGAGR
ncbi:MAG: ABC transporter ATP-binding protein [Gemmatimonadetes bacterium]|nr:ABC transporter ATP-binding protein [Gemmatimonadota bacterium]MCA9762741.1 ABC transporter ATP-binding protein [Gemmatimonadota bacterium]MCB9505000.1 ABC transporter ATP-binding protein [Gemmatimonadales bacterium]HRX17577.1 ABC transporter ATP-binding protein [Gemmatimonadales bacterium]